LAPIVLETARELSQLWPLRVGVRDARRRDLVARLPRRRAAA